MKRALTTVFCLGLLFAFGSAFAGDNKGDNQGNKADTVAKVEPEQANAAVTMEAMIKMNAHRTDAMEKAGVLPSPDGSDLALSCKAEAEGFDAGYCLGVVEGVIASMKVCKRDRSAITLGEAADAIDRYLTSHPDKLNQRDVVLARKALSKAYPCGHLRR
jgi:hypothetical protein